MQTEKENVDFLRKNNIMKLPTSKSQTKYFNEDKTTIKDEEKRVPLQTLKSTTENHSQTAKNKPDSPFIGRYVTVRNKVNDDLTIPVDLLIFEEPIPLIVISDDEDRPKASTSRVTPADGSKLENKAVKNIKKSLKRPHSRELQAANDRKEEYEKVSKKLRTERICERISLPDEGMYICCQGFSN